MLQGQCAGGGAWLVSRTPVTVKPLVGAFGCILHRLVIEKISSEPKLAEIAGRSAFALCFLKLFPSVTVFPS